MSRDQIEKLFGEEWVDFMVPFVDSAEFPKIFAELKRLKTDEQQVVYPSADAVFRCFKELPLSKVRVVLVGQDPYHNPGYANGLAFAHNQQLPQSPSLQFVVEAIERDVYAGLWLEVKNFNNELTQWQDQGILLLNSALTVKEAAPGSHAAIWAPFIEYVIKRLSHVKRNVIYTFWGKQAQGFMKQVDIFTNFVKQESHPASGAHSGAKQWNANCFSWINTVITANALGDKIVW